MIQDNQYHVIVIGGGPAGLTAAIYLARARYSVLVIEKDNFGGQITKTSQVVNYPGIVSISGEELTRNMEEQVKRFGGEFLFAEVNDVDLEGDLKTVKTSKGTFQAVGVLVATGAHPRTVGFKGEDTFRGHGVAYCATCDGEFFTGREIFVVGGGFAAAEEGVFLTTYGTKVNILVREGDFTCSKSVAKLAYDNPKVNVIPYTEVEEVSGDGRITKVITKNNQTGEIIEYNANENDYFGVFVFAGYAPETGLFKNILDLDERGYLKTSRNLETNIPGVYGAGDVCIKPLRQVVTATGDGALAATELEKYVSGVVREKNLEIKQATVVKKEEKEENESGIFTSEIISQLKGVFEKLTSKVSLRLALDSRAVSLELKQYIETMAELSEKVDYEVVDNVEGLNNLPYVEIFREDGSSSGIRFHGVPGGHEFTSFVLGIYNAGSAGQGIDETVKEKILQIKEKKSVKVFVSLSCTMCPAVVSSLYRIVTLNNNINVDVYDLNHYSELREKYEVMSVPAMIINDGNIIFGKKSMEEIVESLEK